jgi:hypothetical protein
MTDTTGFVDITEHQWEPEFVRHYNLHDAHADGCLVRHGSFKGPVFQMVTPEGRVLRSGAIYPLPTVLTDRR